MLGFEDAKLKTLKAEYTAEEIAQQPATWKKTRRQLEDLSGGIKAFIKNSERECGLYEALDIAKVWLDKALMC